MLKDVSHTAYLAPVGFEDLLIGELSQIQHVYGRLIFTEGPPQRVYWAQNIWYGPRVMKIASIREASDLLRGIQRNWWPYAYQYFRRMELIQKHLPHLSKKPLEFLAEIPKSPLGSWTLIDENTLLASPHCSSPLPNGEWDFMEDKIHPPSRAYLKLWEFFTRFRMYPTKQDICLDLGASPGGWTLVLANLAKHVISYDRSVLDKRVMAMKNVTFIEQDAFKVNLALHPEVTWVFSDIVCFPQKLYEFIKYLLENFPDKKYVFTIKFQGSNYMDFISRFASLPGNIVHLSQNKHELTWYKIDGD